ncbi:MAG TPA: hypothetical protein VEW48_09785, partial [Thermoanaerobaculia bacterium]|nr:hypothetical protein [Thermoanaerobaculia bacterium]
MTRPRAALFPLTLALPILLIGACRPSEPEGETAPSTTAAPAPAPTPQASLPTAPAPATSDLGTDMAPAPEAASPAASLPQDRPLRAGFLVVDGIYNTELAAPYDVFQHTAFHTKPGIEAFTVSPNGQPV